ncbi:type II CRISPR RNA-guided endonuclease Cas9 [Pseudoflavitalea rhizosphaerae]|uniref:type II CRISPR RNA-guided endonuclease Cas9 n=1 Tax=Pseudoflavitalea rhizosphaerae TaxID=1884793 RepID=UPI0019D089B2|nr:type II CRISPR RNA-guided endonuclease Cas9 [Pseudoflavitalea rhizosphaerae]
MIKEYLKCLPASHSLFQEFRLWNFIQRIRIIEKEKQENGKLVIDDDVTNEYLATPEQKADLFQWLNERKEIDEKAFLKYPGFQLGKNAGNFRWNHLPDKKYPANETRTAIKSRLKLVTTDAEGFLTQEREVALWHILYSVENKADLEKALKTFATKHNLDLSFVEQFRKFPPFENDHGAYSQKSLNKLLPLIRSGKYWNENDIDSVTRQRIDHLVNAEADETISETVRKQTGHMTSIEDFQGLPEWLATSIVYNRHAESDQANKWDRPDDIQLVPQHSLRNPIVEKIVNETLRVVKDIWVEYGQSQPGFFQEIHVELGREMKNPNEKRKQITDQNRVNENTHLRLKALLLELMNDGTFENVRPHSPMQLEILKLYEEGALSSNEVPEDIATIAKLPQPSSQQLLKYKLWLQQRYRSPYTGAIIPLTKLFTRDYDIEHIIPRSRFFDDSFNNKVICERVINSDYKDNRLAYEFISQKGGTPVPELSNGGKPITIFTLAEYEHFIKLNYSGNKSKLKRLMMAEIPESFIQRQLNDSRYISKMVKQLLSNVVREQNEEDATSKNLLVSNGSITSTLRQHWGLNDIWSQLVAPRFERMNAITKSNDYGQWVNKEGKKYFQAEVPLTKQKNFSKKRIDHRHHALDAIIVACTTRNHVNFMNNEHAADKGNIRYELRQLLCEKKNNQPGSGDYSWFFKKPWATFTEEVKSSLQNIIPSFRQQVVILTRARNKHLAWRKDEQGNLKKILVTQQSAHHWAIRKPLHQATVSGRVELASVKQVRLMEAIPQWKNIVDKRLRSFIKKLVLEGNDEKQLVQYFKKTKNLWNGQDISKVEVHFRDADFVASRKELDDKFDKKRIAKVTSPAIQNILLKHLAKFDEVTDGAIKENPEKAFSPEGLEELNRNIIELNDGKFHKPIYKVRLAEITGYKFQVGQSYNSRHKYVEAEKGTNLFFGIYLNEKGNRVYETIRLDEAIERRKQGELPVPERNADGHPLLFSLSPNDLIYMPDEDEIENGKVNVPEPLSLLDVRKIYKIVNFTGVTLLAIPCHVAKLISDGQEFTSGNKLQLALNGLSIREKCVKLIVDRLGQVKKLIQ